MLTWMVRDSKDVKNVQKSLGNSPDALKLDSGLLGPDGVFRGRTLVFKFMLRE